MPHTAPAQVPLFPRYLYYAPAACAVRSTKSACFSGLPVEVTVSRFTRELNRVTSKHFDVRSTRIRTSFFFFFFNNTQLACVQVARHRSYATVAKRNRTFSLCDNSGCSWECDTFCHCSGGVEEAFTWLLLNGLV